MRKITLVAAFIGMMSVANAQTPIAYWTFDNSKEDLMATNSLGSVDADDATFTEEGVAGAAVVLDGSYWLGTGATDLADNEDALAISVLINPDELPAAPSGIYEKDIQVRTLLLTDGRLQFVLATANNGWYSVAMESKTALAVGEWSHVVFVYDGAEMLLYINGELDVHSLAYDYIDDNGDPQVAEVAVTGAVVVSAQGLKIGSGAGHESFENYKGKMDDMMMFGEVIDATFVKALYDGYTPSMAIEDNNFSSSISLYPNPAANFVTVENIKANSNINILNVTGQSVYKTVSSSDKLSVDVSSFANGIYFMTVENGAQKGVKKFTVSK